MNKATQLIYNLFDDLIDISTFDDDHIHNSCEYENQCIDLLENMDITKDQKDKVDKAWDSVNWLDLAQSFK